LLTEGLVAAGHRVTLFATADSITEASLHATAPCGWSEDATIDAKVAECLHVASVFEHAGDFDIIHNGFDFLPLTYSGLVTTPVVTTIHGFSSDRIVPVYRRYDSACAYVSISDSDRHPDLHYAATIHHGIDIDGFTVDPSHGEHLLFFGRIHPDKGTASARAEVLAGAHALLHLIDFDEPFGYSVVEAMACGTPVIANARGSMGELIEHEVTGFLVDDIESAVAAVAAAGDLDRRKIARLAAQRFTVTDMIDKYVHVYREVIGNRN
jgi:glycosyltransferase involved in cell wall biosynthesis